MGAPLAGRLPERAFAGVLFDMDGTLIDSLGRTSANTSGIHVLPGAREAFESLERLGVPHAIVTSCERDLAAARLAASGLPRPSVMVTASDVSHGKPGPEPYERGAGLLGLSPADCVVVEDATAGLVSGRAAGAGVLVPAGNEH